MYDLNCRIPGDLHDGFYRAFFPARHVPGEIITNQAPVYARGGGPDPTTPLLELVAICHEYKGWYKWRTGRDDVKLWVTGHSLGAALASMFVIILTSAQGREGNDDPNRGPADDLKFLGDRLRGLCTFGNPQVASSRATKVVWEAIKRKSMCFVRVRNRNDVVSTVPFANFYISEMGEFLRWLRPSGAVRSLALTLDYAPIGPTELRLGHNGIAQYKGKWTTLSCEWFVFYASNAWAGSFAFFPALCAWVINAIVKLITLGFIPVIVPGKPPISAVVQSIASSPLLWGGIGTWLFDHQPSEYARHIAMRAERVAIFRQNEDHALQGRQRVSNIDVFYPQVLRSIFETLRRVAAWAQRFAAFFQGF
jgi:hypothetical protein